MSGTHFHSAVRMGGDRLTVGRYLLLTGILILSTIQDFREHRISSRLLLAGALSEILIRLIENHFRISFLCSAAADLLLPMIILFPLFFIDALGAGDIKLCSLISAGIGFMNALSVIYLALCLGTAWFLITLPAREPFRREPFAWTFLFAFILFMRQQGGSVT